MFKLVISRFRIVPLLAVGAVFVFLACRLTQSEKVEQTISFNKFYDSLAQFDSVQITMKDTSGHTIDNIYHGKVDTIAEIMELPAPHWDGGKVIVSILGYRGGEIVYHMDRKFDGATNKSIDTTFVILPNTVLSILSLDLQLTEGDSVPLPTITVTPLELKDKSLSYMSSSPLVLQVGSTGLKALQRGTASLTVTLKSNPSKFLVLNVTIVPNPLVPDSLFVTPDTLRLAAEGAPGNLSVRVAPSSADPAVTWSVRDATIGQVAEGSVQGLKAGSTVVFATSKRKPAQIDSAILVVSAPVTVAQVRFQFESLELFVGGAADSLTVEVLPLPANPKIELVALDPAIVAVFGGRVQGLRAGATKVIARSVTNPSASDTLSITVYPVQNIDSVAVAQDTLRLFTGGATGTLTARVFPLSMNQTVLWRASNPTVASVDTSGKATPKSPGMTQVVALSRADSSKKDSAVLLVKRDMPQVSVGRDTVVLVGSTLSFRPKVAQEYGGVATYRWDLNGDGVPDGSSDSIKSVSMTYTEAKEIIASFYVRDTEGNDTTVYRKIKAVSGQAVQILDPVDSSYTRLLTIAVKWTVNNKEQDSLKTQTLVLGKNTITRSAKDEAGNLYSSSVTVFVDTTPPNKPLVHGPAYTISKTPTWTWASGGGGGNGTYKYWLDVDDSSMGKQTTDTAFTSGMDLAEGIHTLFLAERDRAGNWSGTGRFSVKIDTTRPNAPPVTVTPASPTNVRKPKWTWAPSGEAIVLYQYKLDNNNLATGATSTTDTSFTPVSNLAVGAHTLYVQERDSAGNWSASGTAAIVIDTIPPNAPVVTALQTSPTNEPKPTWNWTSGGNGGKGIYRYKLADTLWASGGQTGAATSFTPGLALAEGVQTLYVEEQDSAGNWSGAGNFALTLDLTPPGAPKMDSTPYSPVNSLKPTWTWKTGGGGTGTYRCKVDNADVSGGTLVTTTSYTPSNNLSEARHTLYVQERDAAGNWSASSIRTLVVALSSVTTALPSGVTGTSIGVLSNGTPFVGLGDPGSSNNLSLYYKSNPNWNLVTGSGMTVDQPPSLVIDSHDNLYLGGVNQGLEGRPALQKYNGSIWRDVGEFFLDTRSSSDFNLAISRSDTLYAAYIVGTNSIIVKKFNGSAWIQVAPSETLYVNSFYHSLAIGIDNSGVPYLATLNVSKLTVRKLIGQAWQIVGSEEFANTSTPRDVSIAFTESNEPIVAICDGGSNNKASVFKFSGTGWVPYGMAGFSDGTASKIRLQVSPSGIPYVAFEEEVLGAKRLTVMGLRGGQWIQVGTPVSLTSASYISIDIDKDDIPYVSFQDETGGSSTKVLKASFNPN